MTDQAEVNYRWFKTQRQAFVDRYGGLHALLHDQSVDEFFDTSIDAIRAGLTRHGEGNFSVEPVDDSVEDLGFFSHVGATFRA